jgi:hypothetical protein
MKDTVGYPRIIDNKSRFWGPKTSQNIPKHPKTQFFAKDKWDHAVPKLSLTLSSSRRHHHIACISAMGGIAPAEDENPMNLCGED